jgi:hypothetical protein
MGGGFSRRLFYPLSRRELRLQALYFHLDFACPRAAHR